MLLLHSQASGPLSEVLNYLVWFPRVQNSGSPSLIPTDSESRWDYGSLAWRPSLGSMVLPL